LSLSIYNRIGYSKEEGMIVIKFGSWGVKGTPKYKYSRLLFVHIPYLFGGVSIPLPLCRKEKWER
jgi:hypothetical protein